MARNFCHSKVINITSASMSMPHGVGTFHFMEPELFNNSVKYNEKVDVHAFSVIRYFIKKRLIKI